MPEQPRRPEVRLTASSAPADPSVDDAAPPPRRPLLLLLVPLALLLAAVVLPSTPAPEDRPNEPAPTLVLLPDQLSVTQGGVLVVPVELRNPGGVLQIRSAGAYAEPVREDPVLQAPEQVQAGGQRRFVALVAPDCRLLQPGSPLRFQASLLLKVARGSAGSDLLLDLASEPAVRDTVVSLCRR